MPRRIAIVGIDGSGKSTVISRCRDRLRGCRLVRFPGFHGEPGVTLEELSRDLGELAKIAEELTSAELKLTAFYLLATMFGPIEHEVVHATPTPLTLLEERHAVIDFITYLPSYLSMMRRMAPLCEVCDEARQRLTARRPGSASRIESWIGAQAARVGGPTRLEDHPALLYELETLAVHALIDRLEHACGVDMPHVLVVLDVPPRLAYNRLLQRGGMLDMHEQRDVLDELQVGYRRTLADLVAHRPGCAIHVIDVGDGDAPEQIAQRVISAIDLDRDVVDESVK